MEQLWTKRDKNYCPCEGKGFGQGSRNLLEQMLELKLVTGLDAQIQRLASLLFPLPLFLQMPRTKSIIFTKAAYSSLSKIFTISAYSISMIQPFLRSKFIPSPFHPAFLTKFPFYFWSAYFLIKFPFYFWFISADPWRLLDPCRLPQPFFLTPAPEDFLQKFRTMQIAFCKSPALWIHLFTKVTHFLM